MKDSGKSKISKGTIAIIVIIAVMFVFAFTAIILGEKMGVRAVAQIELASDYVQKVESINKAATEALAKRDKQIDSLVHQDSLQNKEMEKVLQQLKFEKLKIRRKDAENDSLRAVINSIRQSDI